jgi:hypothetical protein
MNAACPSCPLSLFCHTYRTYRVTRCPRHGWAWVAHAYRRILIGWTNPVGPSGSTWIPFPFHVKVPETCPVVERACERDVIVDYGKCENCAMSDW